MKTINKIETLLRTSIAEALREISTKDNKEITFKIIPNAEANKNSTWVVDKVEAFVDEKLVGYLNISYIPHERFEKRFPTLLHYLAYQRGMSYLDRFNFSDPQERNEAILMAMGINYWNRPSEEDMANPDYYKTMEKALYDKYGKEYAEFKDFHVDKPLVDYIRVDEDQRRKGIGIGLYNFGAQYLAKKGFKLYASGLQTDQAKAAWEYLKKTHGANIGTEISLGGKVRTFLSYL